MKKCKQQTVPKPSTGRTISPNAAKAAAIAAYAIRNWFEPAIIDNLCPTPPIRQIAVAAHPRLTDAIVQAGEISSYLKELGAEIQQGLLYDEHPREKRIKAGKFDAMIAIGGDGTMLRAGHLCGPNQIPILGINVGRFGFLMEIQQNQWREIFTASD